ncbi:MAG: hypothetical protein KAH32_09110, partial [Chlamydiia bacterium]|nr:hypothetical protein [Chlamydiia bacterium]
MAQDYAVFKTNSPAEATNKYYQECIDQVKVHIVITTKRKYASIDYDFDTLNNDKQHIKNKSNCQISDKISAYAHKYAKDKQLPSERRPKVICDSAGGFEIYIEDVDIVGNDISKIIDDIVKSGCIVFKTMEELMDELDPE